MTEGLAKKRWALLRAALQNQGRETLDKALTQSMDVSVRRPVDLGLFSRQPDVGGDCDVACMVPTALVAGRRDNSEATSSARLGVRLRLPAPKLSLTDFSGQYSGFLNTGNICLWPAEEVLGYICLKHATSWRSKSICELGAGATGFAGIVASSVCSASRVLITDGNPESVARQQFISCPHEEINENIQLNQTILTAQQVDACQLLWSESHSRPSEDQRFDLIMAADCTFYPEMHAAFLATADALLKEDGCIWIVAPERGQTLSRFLATAQERCLQIVGNIAETDEVLIAAHRMTLNNSGYQEDIHFPRVYQLQRAKRG